MRWWKWLGLAGLAGITVAAGTVAVRRRRQRAWDELDPEELRDRLHDRLAEAD